MAFWECFLYAFGLLKTKKQKKYLSDLSEWIGGPHAVQASKKQSNLGAKNDEIFDFYFFIKDFQMLHTRPCIPSTLGGVSFLEIVFT